MKQVPSRRQRCAIYTRKSTEHNLDLTFTSLDAQREACEAYIKSQAHEGCTLVRDRFDDGGLSGASLDRPALQRLLDQVRARSIDTIVVYKVDRLTRSLADFAKLVELFDEHEVSFVSVTQSFNTTSSMGRLTLNVLLSFAQFEREVIGERVRDKIAASKRKGIWVGGPAPDEADLVRKIFAEYLRLGSIGALAASLNSEGLKPKPRKLASGRALRDRPAVAIEAAGRPVVVERGGPDHTSGSIHHRAPAAASHVGCDPAGADAVDQHARPGKLRGHEARQRVQRGLRRTVARRSSVHGREASSTAADIDNAPPAPAAHARRDGLRHRPSAEQIGVEEANALVPVNAASGAETPAQTQLLAAARRPPPPPFQLAFARAAAPAHRHADVVLDQGRSSPCRPSLKRSNKSKTRRTVACARSSGSKTISPEGRRT